MVRHLAKHFSHQGYITKTEVAAGYGRADLVLATLNESKCLIRKKNKQVTPLLKEQYFHILNCLPDIHDKSTTQPVKLSELAKLTPVTSNYLKYELLENLIEAGYVKEVNKELYYKVNGWVPLVKEMIAIEAKLRDWKRGYLQANRYNSFADKTYLAILERHSHSVNLDLLKTHGVGLFTVSDDGSEVKELLIGKPSPRTQSDKRNMVAELYLKDALEVSRRSMNFRKS